MSDDIRSAHAFRLPRSSVTTKRSTLTENPLLPHWFNSLLNKATASPSPTTEVNNMRVIRDLRIDAIAATNTTNASNTHTTIMKASNMSREEQLARLEADVSKLEQRVKASFPSDEDWNDDYDPTEDGDDDTLDASDNGDADDDLDRVAARISRRTGISKAEALTEARRARPDLYRALQRDVRKNLQQHVDDLIKKGHSPPTAAQVAASLYPDAARDSIAKAADSGSVSEFMHRVDLEMQKTGCSRTTAMSAIRKRHPRLYERYRNV